MAVTRKTSHQWWKEVKANPVKLEEWLRAQYHGEITAAERLAQVVNMLEGECEYTIQKTLTRIGEQEFAHAGWIEKLLTDRGMKAEMIKGHKSRYWQKTLPRKYLEIPIKRLAAIGAHAEAMRLKRIKVIANDKTAPADIRKVFQKILPQEEFHARAFRKIAGVKEYRAALTKHYEGLNALGLIA